MATTARTITATPLAMPKLKRNHMPQRPAYTTQTGDKPRTWQETVAFGLPALEDDPHCFVCGRHTDHFAEHDALVDSGLAEYGQDGSVYRTAKWEDSLAAEIAEREYQEYCKRLGLKP